jgi:hypothetical protein
MRKPHLVSLVLGIVLVAGTAVPTAAFAETTTASHPTTKVSARTLLKHLAVKAESHASSYERSEFRLWVDADRDGEDTRAEVLKAESSKPVTESKYHAIKSGHWTSRYDGKTLTSASKLDIDHLVPLEEAWTSGAYKWPAAKREAYANDLGYAASLVAVSAHANRSKGDKEPNAYLPPKKAYRCTYVRNWIAVKARWKLSVDKTEKKHLTADLKKYCSSTSVVKPTAPTAPNVIALPAPSTAASAPATTATSSTLTVSWPSYTCPAGSGGSLAGWDISVAGSAAYPGTTPVNASPRSITIAADREPGTITVRYAAYCGSRKSPYSPATRVAVNAAAPVPTSTPTPTPTPTLTPAPPVTSTPVAPQYANCAAADAAGVSPIYSWQSGYSSNLDGDHDGVACEAGDPYSTNPNYTPPSYPSGATAICRDGSYSYSANRSGTCSGHGGVSRWL